MPKDHPTLLERLRSAAASAWGDPERRMASLSLASSLAALGLMLTGFVMLMLEGEPYRLPGGRALSLHTMVTLRRPAIALDMMSMGIVLLLLLPVLRIVIAVIPFARRRRWFDVAVTIVVFLELVFSIVSGR